MFPSVDTNVLRVNTGNEYDEDLCSGKLFTETEPDTGNVPSIVTENG
jgi:hypothetical protein